MTDASSSVVRRVAASLGEVLFYVATSSDEGEGDAGGGGGGADECRWEMPGWAPEVLRGCVARQGPSGSDAVVVCHYATRTVENILAKSDACAPALCTREMGGALFALLCRADTEALRVTAARALSGILRRAPALRGHVLARADEAVRAILSGLRDGSSALQVRARVDMHLRTRSCSYQNTARLQAPLLNILNACLVDGGGGGGGGRGGGVGVGAAAARPVRHALLAAAGGGPLVPALTRIAERALTPSLAGKAVLSLAVLLRCDDVLPSLAAPLSLHLAGDPHVIGFVDRIVARRPATAPPSPLVVCLRVLIEDMVAVVLDAVAGALAPQAPATVRVHAAAGRGSPPPAYVPALGAVRALRALLGSPNFAALLASESLLQHAVDFYGAAAALVPSGSLAAMYAETSALMDALVARGEALLAPLGALPCALLLPPLARALDVESGARRQDAGRLLADVLAAVLSGPARALDDAATAGAVAARVDADVVARLPALLHDADPVVPAFAMRALRAVAEWRRGLVPTEAVASLVRRLPLALSACVRALRRRVCVCRMRARARAGMRRAT